MRQRQHSHAWRDRAFRRGLGAAGAILVFAYGIVGGVLLRLETFSTAPLLALHIIVLGPGTALLIVGAIYWRRAHRLDDRSFLVEAATPLPARLVLEDDHAWITGQLCVPDPVRALHFDRECAWYELAEYRQKYAYGRGSWQKVRETAKAAPAWLVDHGAGVRLTFDGAVKDGLPEKVRQQGDTRFRLRFVPAEGTLSVCGLVRRGGDSMAGPGEDGPTRRRSPDAGPLRAPEGSRAWERAREREARARGETALDGRPIPVPPETPWVVTATESIPLVVTPVSRNEWVDRAEAAETEHLVAASVQLFFGLGTVAWAVLVFLIGAAPSAGLTFLLSGAASVSVLAAFALVAMYNRFVLVRQRTKNAWARFETDRELRHDLIPPLIELVKAHARFERETIRAVAEARGGVLALREGIDAANRAGETAKSLFAVAEQYPDLRAHESFTMLMDRLTAVEDKLAHGRSFFNEVVEEYNTLVTSLPNVLLARPLGFHPLPFWRL